MPAQTPLEERVEKIEALESNVRRQSRDIREVKIGLSDLTRDVQDLSQQLEAVENRLDAKIDAQTARLDAKIDAQGVSLTAEIQSVGKQLDAKIVKLGEASQAILDFLRQEK